MNFIVPQSAQEGVQKNEIRGYQKCSQEMKADLIIGSRKAFVTRLGKWTVKLDAGKSDGARRNFSGPEGSKITNSATRDRLD
jgi:hypothetical protein